uniref:Programmed cell death protein 7 n=1 Tax=Anopheles culicifacies TaxID=139723 RepID=A0A182LXR9_9DIPT
MFAHELCLLDTTKPPPPIDDSFPHPTLLEQLRMTDVQRVEQFLATVVSRNVRTDCKVRSSTIPISISTCRAELCEALHVLENLKHSSLVLDDLLLREDESDTRWTEELDRAKQLRRALVGVLEPLENVERKQHLMHKLAKRHKKRAWQKRRNKRLQEDRKAEQAIRTQRLEEIAAWEAEWKDRLDRERVAREELQMKTIILNDVRRRKARAKRMLTRFEKAVQLQQQRRHVPSTNTCGSEERLVTKMDALITEWKGKLGECVKEEKRLKAELNRQSTGNVSRRRENRWRKVLFGSAALGAVTGHRSNDDWWQELIAVRRAWDKFSLPSNTDQNQKEDHMTDGESVAPTTWIVPPEQPLPEWDVYQERKTTKR